MGGVRRSTGRRRVAVVLAAVVAAGLLVATRAGSGAAGDVAGDLLYAMAVLGAIALVRPTARLSVQTGAAYAFCVLVECLQLTGFSAAAGARWHPLRYVLGTTFAPRDLLVYAGGVVVGALLLRGRTGADDARLGVVPDDVVPEDAAPLP